MFQPWWSRTASIRSSSAENKSKRSVAVGRRFNRSVVDEYARAGKRFSGGDVKYVAVDPRRGRRLGRGDSFRGDQEVTTDNKDDNGTPVAHSPRYSHVA